MRFVQHKKEALWFYRFLSPMYDRWVNPLFWTASMRDAALELAELGDPALDVVDVGAGTGFSTEGVVRHVDAARVTMLDQSPDQLGRAARKPALAAAAKVRGDAEDLPFATDRFDRWISCGSVEYWPEPQRAVAEAYRVVKPGGLALLVGPLPPRNGLGRLLADLWMLFPRERDYREWFERAGFTDVRAEIVLAPWHREGTAPYGLAIAGRKPAPGASPLVLAAEAAEHAAEPWTPVRAARFALRFVLGSLAGAAFVPIGLVLNLRARRARAGG
jgi:MPBQ/MSBQ methyltransferase